MSLLATVELSCIKICFFNLFFFLILRDNLPKVSETQTKSVWEDKLRQLRGIVFYSRSRSKAKASPKIAELLDLQYRAYLVFGGYSVYKKINSLL